MRGWSPRRDATVQWMCLTAQALEANTGDNAKTIVLSGDYVCSLIFANGDRTASGKQPWSLENTVPTVNDVLSCSRGTL